MATVRCNYCNWVGDEPSSAEYETLEEWEAAMDDFRDSHDNMARNYCPMVEEAQDVD